MPLFLSGEILYIGPFEFLKWDFSDRLRALNYFQDEAAARQVLVAYPGISGPMVTYDPAKSRQSVSRCPGSNPPPAPLLSATGPTIIGSHGAWRPAPGFRAPARRALRLLSRRHDPVAIVLCSLYACGTLRP